MDKIYQLAKKTYKKTLGKIYMLNRIIFLFYGLFSGMKGIRLDDERINIICPLHIGDIYYVGILSKAISCTYKKNINLIIPQRYIELKNLFESDILKFSCMDSKTELLINRLKNDAYYFFSKKERKNLIIDTITKKKADQVFCGIHMIDTIIMHYKLEKPVFILPQISENVSEELKKIFLEKQLEMNNTVMLFPEANSCVNFLSEEWVNLAENLISLGFKVCFNSKNSNYDNYPKIFLGIIDTLDFLRLCGYMIALRSGICDLTQEINIKQIILYPANCIINKLENILWKDISELNKYKNHDYICEKAIMSVNEVSKNEIKIFFERC